MDDIETSNDEMWPDRRTSRFFDVHVKTIGRWERNPKLGFPPAVKINGHKYRRAQKIREFANALARKGLD
jgi:hypothetical protein